MVKQEVVYYGEKKCLKVYGLKKLKWWPYPFVTVIH